MIPAHEPVCLHCRRGGRTPFGLDIGVIAGALPFITDHFALSSRLQEWVVSSMMLGAAVGALFNGWLSFDSGRKYSLMVGAILFVAGSIGSAFADSVEVLLLARVLPRRCRQGSPTPRRFISLKWRVKMSAGR